MTWAIVRGEMSDVLTQARLSITEPKAIAIKRVYEFPPAAVEPGNVPCFIMMPPARNQDWAGSDWRTRTYEMRVQCLVQDENAADAAHIVDAFAEAAMDLAVPTLRLNLVDSALAIVRGPQIDEPSLMTYGGRNYVGFDMHITFHFEESVPFAVTQA